MDPEESPELPPLARGSYNLDAILAAAEEAEFAIPPMSKTSFNNSFASSTPSGFSATFSPSDPSSTGSAPPPGPQDRPPAQSSERRTPAVRAKKPVVSAASTSSITSTTSAAPKKRVSTLKSTISKFAAAKRTELSADSSDTGFGAGGIDIHIGTIPETTSTDHEARGSTFTEDHAITTTATTTTIRSTETENTSTGSMMDERSTPSSRPDDILSPTPTNTIGRRSRPFKSTIPFHRVGSPSSHLEVKESSPSRANSPIDNSSHSLGANDQVAYSTPSSSRPTSRPSSRPTSRPSSRVSNGRYHSRQLSSDSLLSFNAMVNKEDLEDEEREQSAGHMSLLVSDPEHIRILEDEIEDPFSPSLSAIDPDADALLNNLIQQTSPFGSRKPSRGSSPAFKNRRQQRATATDGDDSFLYSTDDALSDKEPGSKLRTSKPGTRTPSSPLARALTRSSPLASSANTHLSLDQVLQSTQEFGGFGPVKGAGSGSLATLQENGSEADQDFSTGENLDSSLTRQHVEVDIVVQNVNVGDDLRRTNTNGNLAPPQGIMYSADYSDVEDELNHTDIHLNLNQSNVDILTNEEILLHESIEHHGHAQSFAEWMSSSAEISRLEISPPMNAMPGPPYSQHLSLPSFGSAMTPPGFPSDGVPVSMTGTSLLSPTLGDVNVLTSSYTPALSPPSTSSPLGPTEAGMVAGTPPSQSVSPTSSRKAVILEKRSHLIEDLLSKARERTRNKSEVFTLSQSQSVEREKTSTAEESTATTATTTTTTTTTITQPSGSESSPRFKTQPNNLTSPSSAHSVSFAAMDEIKLLEKLSDEEEEGETKRELSISTAAEKADAIEMMTGAMMTSSAPTSAMLAEKREGALLRRASSIVLSSRIRDSTNLDAPRYSIREMEDMKMNVRMDLRIEITNEIREEYERSAEQEASIYQSEIEELKASLEKERQEKQELKGVLDEFESSLADIAVSTAKEIQTLKEENKKLSDSREETEDAFIMLKSRYDELRDLNSKHVENEGILRKAVDTLKQDFETSERRFEELREHADSKLTQAGQGMEIARMRLENEIGMLKTQLNRQEMQRRTLEQALEVKNKENEDLILFSEELIAKLE